MDSNLILNMLIKYIENISLSNIVNFLNQLIQNNTNINFILTESHFIIGLIVIAIIIIISVVKTLVKLVPILVVGYILYVYFTGNVSI